MYRKFFQAALAILFLSVSGIAYAGLDLERLSPDDIKMADEVMAKLGPLIKERQDKGTAPVIVFGDLYRVLDVPQETFVKKFLQLDGKKLGIKIPYRGYIEPGTNLVEIKNQVVGDPASGKGKVRVIPRQYLPEEVYQRFTKMNRAMKRDIGRTLFVDSGYRSGAYQLYLFLSYLKKHNYSIRETARFVALPGYSEHGSPAWQAIDFINIDGVNEDSPGAFVNLPEYKWLVKHAAVFGFVLSYPEGNDTGITFEPWHWRCENSSR